jgi:hypothetical protein
MNVLKARFLDAQKPQQSQKHLENIDIEKDFNNLK